MSITRFSAIQFCCLLIALLVVLPASAQTTKKKSETPNTLDEQLLQGLDNDLLEGLDNIPTTSAGKNGSDDKSKHPQPDGIKEYDNSGNKSADPLERIGRKMQTVQARIDAQDTTSGTQRLQQDIIDQLAVLIQEAQKKCSACESKSPPKPGRQSQKPASGNPGQSKQAAKDSTQRLGTTESDIDVAQNQAADELFKQAWGHLPERVRRQMQSVTVERFLPKYEKLIEQYYKRLAQQHQNKP